MPAEFAANDAMESSPKAKGGKKGTLPKVIKKEKAAKSQEGGFAAFSAEGKKVIISPADELDEDEKSLARSNPVALFLLATFAPGIYLVFYVLGSIEVI